MIVVQHEFYHDVRFFKCNAIRWITMLKNQNNTYNVWYVPLAAALLVSTEGFNGRVATDLDAQVVQPELLLDSFA